MPQSRGKHGAMRFLVLALIAVSVGLAPAAFASEWTRYVNPRFGAAADIPAGFAATGPSAEGDGRAFRADNGRATLSVWGAPAMAGFSEEVRARIGRDEAEGWAITYRSETPDWAAWSGSRGGHVFYAKAIATCAGRQTAHLRFTYPVADIAHFDPIVARLGQSLDQDGACF